MKNSKAFRNTGDDNIAEGYSEYGDELAFPSKRLAMFHYFLLLESSARLPLAAEQFATRAEQGSCL